MIGNVENNTCRGICYTVLWFAVILHVNYQAIFKEKPKSSGFYDKYVEYKLFKTNSKLKTNDFYKSNIRQKTK
jgi:hypothetical protein